jgi:hypothetical protein
MIQLIDQVDCDSLHKSVVKPEAFKKALLVQDAERKDQLFALLMVGDKRAVLIKQGLMSLHSATVTATLKLQAFRTLLDKADVRGKELKFCAPRTYEEHAANADRFDLEWFVPPTFPDLVERFALWRAGRATW